MEFNCIYLFVLLHLDRQLKQLPKFSSQPPKTQDYKEVHVADV